MKYLDEQPKEVEIFVWKDRKLICISYYEGDESKTIQFQNIENFRYFNDNKSHIYPISGKPLSDETLVEELEHSEIEVDLGLPKGKVHGSLKKKSGRTKTRFQYNRRFVHGVTPFGRRRGPNSNSGPAT
ncbi:hypothetical protein ABEB36_005076 [Hypothenemus hampei]|uniref:Uncharacterized protein n=1 Tax=Hypothenemus hampei TaxID=57062 RepID=A0ABD1EWY6_HYPHA